MNIDRTSFLRASSAPSPINYPFPPPERRKKTSVPDEGIRPKELCTTYIPMAIKIKGGPFMKVEKYEKVTILSSEQPRRGIFRCCTSTEEGLLSDQYLDINQHTANIYLEALDVLLEHPILLKHLITNEFQEVPCHPKTLLQLLQARKVLRLSLKILFREELSNAKASGNSTTLLRESTPAIKFCSALLTNNQALDDFRHNFVARVLDTVRQKTKNKPIDNETLMYILGQSLDYLHSLQVNQYPHEVQLILFCLRETAKKVQDTPLSSLLGSIFFLRCLVPSLVQPDDKKLRLTHIEKENLKQITKALQCVSNEQCPHWLEACHHDAFTKLVERTSPLLIRISSELPQNIVPTESLVSEAATYYWLIMREGQKIQNQDDLQSSLEKLRLHLGTVPAGPGADVPRQGEIDMICDTLRKMSMTFI